MHNTCGSEQPTFATCRPAHSNLAGEKLHQYWGRSPKFKRFLELFAGATGISNGGVMKG